MTGHHGFIENLGVENPILYGVTDGKAVGTYVEQEFHRYLGDLHEYDPGNAAMGIDFPAVNVDLKVTSIKQPQSSGPFRDAGQKVYLSSVFSYTNTSKSY